MLRREVEGNKIKPRGESHFRGWWTPLRRVGREHGGGNSWLPGVPARKAHTMSRSLRGRRVTIVVRLGGGVSLAATWDHLQFFSLPHIRGGGAQEGGGVGSRRLRRVCSRCIRRRGGRAVAIP